MTWALLAALVVVSMFAIGEALFIRHLIATMEKLDEVEKPAPEPEVADPRPGNG